MIIIFFLEMTSGIRAFLVRQRMRGGGAVYCFARSSSAYSETDPRKCASLAACDGKRRPLAKTGLRSLRSHANKHKVDVQQERELHRAKKQQQNKEGNTPNPNTLRARCQHTTTAKQASKKRESWLHRPLGPPHASASRVGPAAQHTAGCAGDDGHGCAPSVLDVSYLSPASQYSKLALREGRGL